MGLFDFIKRLFGAERPITGGRDCPQCGFGYRWDGLNCAHCGYPRVRRAQRPSSTQHRDYSAGPHQPPPTAPLPPPAPVAPVSPARTTPASGTQSSSTLTGLDAEKFAPMTREDAMAATGGANWRTAYLDPLNIIPSEDLPRIKVINGTMVGLGLITAEELAKIHEVGREMDELRGDFRAVEAAGHRAVAASREDRERVKQQKKQEAAERKKARADAIAQRRATDIVYLGRGVSKGLADRRANVEKLEANGLPVLASPADVAQAMDLTIPRLRWLAYHSEAPRRVHYINFTVPKKSGGQRVLSAPHRDMAEAQQWVLDHILRKLPVHDAAHGFVTGRSTVTNAQPHVGADVVVNADLTDFFPTINYYRVAGVFRSMGYSPAVAVALGLLCTECPRRKIEYAGEVYYPAVGPRALPQGACTSPGLSNLVARNLDARLSGIALRLQWNYTRYADDLTLSASGETAQKVGYMLARVRHITADEGFAVNEKKTRILRRNARQAVTGIVVNDRPGAPRKLVRRVRAILHRARWEGLAAQNRENHPHFESWLLGMIAYIEMANPDQGRPLRAAYRELRMQ